MSGASSRASEVSTLDLSAQGCGSSSKPSPAHGVEASSPSTGPTSRASRTFEKSHRGSGPPADPDKWTESPLSPTLNAHEFHSGVRTPALICSAADSPARISAWRADEPGSLATGQDCSSSSQGPPMSLFDLEDGSSLRTSPACSLPNVDEISQSFSGRWATSGFTTSHGECWTAVTSECPNGGDGSTSLADVLLDEVPERFFLSPRAAAGILRRAEKRGRALPTPLHQALTDLASLHPDDDSTTTRTSSPSRSTGSQGEPTTTAPKRTTLWPRSEPEVAGSASARRKRLAPTSSPQPSSQPSAQAMGDGQERPPTRLRSERSSLDTPRAPTATPQTPSSPEQAAPTCGPEATPAPRSSVRRLTPTECERLQGFPDGWTIPSPTAPAMQPAGMQSPSPSPDGSENGS